MRAKVTLVARLSETRISKNGKEYYPFVPVIIRKGRPQPVEGATSYALRYSESGKRKVEPVGTNLDVAFSAFQNRDLNHTRIRQGLLPIHDAGVVSDLKESPEGRIRVSDSVAKYLIDLNASVKTGEKSPGTLRGYKNAVEDFRDQCGVEYLEEVTGEVLKAHKIWLFENIKKRVRGKKHNTVAKRFRYLGAFLNTQGIQMVKAKVPKKNDEGLMSWGDLPREEKKANIDKYSEAEVKAMLAVADVDEADFIQLFLRTGCRDEEVAFMKWGDVDWKRKQIVITEKPEYNWKPKDKESRTIPLEDGVLLKRLAARRNRQKPASELLFPNTLGEPDMHLIRRLHKIVAKAQENGAVFEGAITLHRFRRTYASMMIAHTDLQTVSALLGHSDIETTSRYLAPDQEKARKGTRTAFEGVGD
jgi:integrase